MPVETNFDSTLSCSFVAFDVVGDGFDLVLDVGCFHGLRTVQQRAMGRAVTARGRDQELEGRDTARGVLSGNQEAHRKRPQADGRVQKRAPGYLAPQSRAKMTSVPGATRLCTLPFLPRGPRLWTWKKAIIMFDKAYFNGLKKRIAPYLGPGEELLSVTPAEPAEMLKGYLFTGELGAQIKGRKLAGQESMGGIRLAANMSLAVTTRRVLLFHFGMGREPKPEFLLGSIPVADAEDGSTTDGGIDCDDVTLNVSTREVTRGNRKIELTTKEFDLLHFFMRHPRQVMTREMLYDRIWGYDFGGESNILEVYIRYLRSKLEASDEPRLIQTVRGVGYALREE